MWHLYGNFSSSQTPESFVIIDLSDDWSIQCIIKSYRWIQSMECGCHYSFPNSFAYNFSERIRLRYSVHSEEWHRRRTRLSGEHTCQRYSSILKKGKCNRNRLLMTMNYNINPQPISINCRRPSNCLVVQVIIESKKNCHVHWTATPR